MLKDDNESAADRKKRFCIMPPCYGKRYDLVHKFPTDNNRAELWRQIVNVPDLYNHSIEEIRKRMYICSKHFAKRDYKHMESRSLNKTAIPTLYLKIGDEEPPSNHSENLIDVDNMDDTPMRKRRCTNSMSEFVDEIDDTPIKKCKYQNSDSTLADVEPKFQTIEIDKDLIYDLDKDFLVDNDDIIVVNNVHANELIEQLEEERVENINVQSFDIMGGESDEPLPISIETHTNGFKINITTDYITITAQNGTDLQLNNIWLRDLCRCKQCWLSDNLIKKQINLINMPTNIRPMECYIYRKSLFVNWSDEHQSEYPIKQLYRNANHNMYNQYIASKLTPFLWDKSNVSDELFTTVNINDYLCKDDAAKCILTGLIKHGIAFINHVPINEQTTEAIVKRLFSIERIHYDRSSENNSNIDTTMPHTSMCYLNAVPGLCIYHSLKIVQKTSFVDGFNVLNNIKESNANAYERLCNVNVTHRYGTQDEQNFRHTAPIIKLDTLTEEPEQIRFNPYTQTTMHTLSQTELTQFYKDYKCLQNEIEENVLQIELKPGTMVLINNWRILEGRQSHDGRIAECFVSYDEFLSVCRKFNLIER